MSEEEFREKVIYVLKNIKISAVDENNNYLFDIDIPQSIIEYIADIFVEEIIDFPKIEKETEKIVKEAELSINNVEPMEEIKDE